MAESDEWPPPDMAVRIYKSGLPEVHSAGSADGCVELIAFDGRCVQVVFRNDGAVMLRGWCGTYKRLEDEAELDYYSRGEMGDETVTFHADIPPVPNPVRVARDERLAALRAEREVSRAEHARKRNEDELRKLADQLGYEVIERV